jgi:3-oxoacyl-[acyl-carrier protein] reductase
MFVDKVVLITGAARGIGYEIAARFAQAGARVALADVDLQAASQAAEHLRQDGCQALAVAADVSDEDQVRRMIEQVVGEWQRIDILVNNAGICPMTPILEISAKEWDRVLSINLKGAFLCSQAVIPVMRTQHSGKIINIASSAGQMGGIAVGVHYSASKAGTFGLTKSLARILAPEIQVNAISPGTTESEMTRGWDENAVKNIIRQIPAGRLGRPEDTAAAVLFLASDEAGFITGQTLSVNGGLLMV